jgi:DNA-directed RNA polymerase specialized sigma24 family protein
LPTGSSVGSAAEHQTAGATRTAVAAGDTGAAGAASAASAVQGEQSGAATAAARPAVARRRISSGAAVTAAAPQREQSGSSAVAAVTGVAEQHTHPAGSTDTAAAQQQATTAAEALRAVLHEPPTQPSRTPLLESADPGVARAALVGDLDAIVGRALQKQVALRYPSAVRLRVLESRSLRSIAAELGVSVMTVSRHEKAALAALREQLA